MKKVVESVEIFKPWFTRFINQKLFLSQSALFAILLSRGCSCIFLSYGTFAISRELRKF